MGSEADCRKRGDKLGRRNARLLTAFERYPPESFRFEILQWLAPGCSEQELRAAEQRHIDRLRAWQPARGFNMHPAVWQGDGPSQRAGRAYRAAITRKMLRDRQQAYQHQLQQYEVQQQRGAIR